MFTIFTTCNVISNVTYILYYILPLSELGMCAMYNTADFLFLFCTFLISCFPGMLLRYFLNDLEIVPVAHIITGIILLLHHHNHHHQQQQTNNITVIPLLEVCSMGYSEFTIKGLIHERANYLLENLLSMDATSIRVGNFYVHFPQDLIQ